MISIYEPDISKYNRSAINAVESGWISNHGEYIEKAAQKIKEVLNCNFAILMANGTCATHCLFLAIKFKHPEIKKIYVPNNAYVAAWNTALMVYSIEQVEVIKMDMKTWNINTDEEYIKTLDSNSAVLIVHNLGNIVNVPRLKSLRPDLIFVEDNCEGLFGKYNGIYSGTSSDTLCSSASFYGNKIITTGEGGVFLTQHNDIYEHIKRVYSQGMSETKYLHDVHAYNYRMTNIQAAFLYDQLTDINNILENKKRIFFNYERLLDELIKMNKVALFEKEENTECANWIFAIRIIGNSKTIEETTVFFRDNGIDIRPFFYPINKHTHLSSIENKDASSETLNQQIIMIPSSSKIAIEEQEKVVDIIYKFTSLLKSSEEDLINDTNIYYRNVLKDGVFSLIDDNFKFELDNHYYKIMRININKFIKETIKNHENEIILEVGPKNNENERIKSKNNILETVDIVEDNNTTYVADLTVENDLPKDYFDAIYCLEVLEHTYEPWEILKQLYKLLKKNGCLYLSLPFQFRIHGPIPDCYRISEFGLKYLLEKNNFTISHFQATIDKNRPAFPLHYTIVCKK
jgi:perosamine synthetase